MIRDGRVQVFGDFISNRTGVCRHAACLLQGALEAEGIPSKLRSGRQATVLKDGSTFSEEFHAWVELDETPYSPALLIDPSSGVHFALEDTVELSHGIRILKTRDFFLGRIQLRYVASELGGANGSAKALDQHELEHHVLRDLSH